MFNHTSLARVDLSQNELQEPSILTGFCKLKNLVWLNLDGNKIEGGIDTCIGNMQALQYLDLNSNLFNGSIPTLSNLTSIEHIGLEGNQFTHVFSFSSLANLSNLKGIEMAYNYELEIETETPTWVPSFQLDIGLHLDNCIINRRSGGGIPSFLSTQKNIYALSLQDTSIKGSIPPWLLSNVQQGLYLRGNKLDGTFPQLQPNKTSQLAFLDVSDNNLTGPLPRNMSTHFTNLGFLNLSFNAFYGSIASSELGFLRILDLSSNNLHGGIPNELTGNGTRLSHLSLSSNNLGGNMFPQDANMSLLSHLRLDNNHFTGGISPNLSNSLSLRTLDLRGNRMSGIIPSVLSSLPELAAILLSGNLFQGDIPIQLCQMQSLRVLDLSNNFLSGTIPHCLNNVTSWKEKSSGYIDENYWFVDSVSVGVVTKGISYSFSGKPLAFVTAIDLSSNQLLGDIPIGMGDLREIQALNLSHNHLSGPIPESFQSLENIESLDLSHNQLVGKIPPHIVRLHYLSVFSVAYNNLYGPVPVDSQFSTFNRSSFEGNPGLCGQLLEVNCSFDGTKKYPFEGRGDEESILDSMLIYALFIAASFATGFWCFIGALVLNRNLRIRYLQTVDARTDAFVDRIFEFKYCLEYYLKC